jgi:hypothetical protein
VGLRFHYINNNTHHAENRALPTKDDVRVPAFSKVTKKKKKKKKKKKHSQPQSSSLALAAAPSVFDTGKSQVDAYENVIGVPQTEAPEKYEFLCRLCNAHFSSFVGLRFHHQRNAAHVYDRKPPHPDTARVLIGTVPRPVERKQPPKKKRKTKPQAFEFLCRTCDIRFSSYIGLRFHYQRNAAHVAQQVAPPQEECLVLSLPVEEKQAPLYAPVAVAPPIMTSDSSESESESESEVTDDLKKEDVPIAYEFICKPCNKRFKTYVGLRFHYINNNTHAAENRVLPSQEKARVPVLPLRSKTKHKQKSQSSQSVASVASAAAAAAAAAVTSSAQRKKVATSSSAPRSPAPHALQQTAGRSAKKIGKAADEGKLVRKHPGLTKDHQQLGGARKKRKLAAKGFAAER